jgi:hypothetical protein
LPEATTTETPALWAASTPLANTSVHGAVYLPAPRLMLIEAML